MVEVRKNRQLWPDIESELTGAMEEAALEAGVGLEARLSYRSMKRTGRKYDKYPRRSSDFGEYPQQQSGRLRSSVSSESIGPLVAAVGLVAKSQNDADKLKYLEKTGGSGVRRPVYMYFEGVDSTRTLKKMATGIRRALRSR